ncbi:MAG: 16S rRNA (guanine(527)-N(7))-methyltransferase RsmG [Eubacterium sp.]|nr:16S rRNA (guanine(527)-N(7))-methyltransferase RsmG [Eubacterium sp.]
MSQYSTDTLVRETKQLGITLSEKQMQQFIRYYELLVEWNSFMNLTAITEYEEVMEKHFVDSLAAVKVCDFHQVKTLIDIGTGAGFPGIPLKIAFPHLEVVLLDSLNKRTKFLNEVINQLGLENIRTIHGRAEDYAKQKEYREQFDVCVSRAVANLSTLSEYCIPYVRNMGDFISYKSGKIEEEVEQARKAVFILGGKISKIEKFCLADTDMERSFVIIKKEKKSPEKYPRKAGMPSKEPLQ